MLIKKHRKHFRWQTLTGLCVIILFLLSCSSSSHNKINTYIAKLKHMIAIKYDKKSAPPLNLQSPTAVSYQMEPTHSPFGAPINPVNKMTAPLLVYPVTMLRFVGTLFENDKVFAYVIAPDNRLYQVKMGDKIGDHQGVITNITKDRIEIMEKVSEAGAKETQHLITLQLKDENK